MTQNLQQEVETASGNFRVAHLSDPHLTSLSRVHWRELLNKRILGYLSWRLRRRHEHRREILDLLVADLKDCQPHQILVTGDLTHVGTPRECEEVADWLHGLAPPDRAMIVPGNHDCYVHTPPESTLDLWAPYLHGDPAEPGGAMGNRFPTLRRRGPVALIGLSSAHPTPPFLASGSLGTEQLDALGSMLRAAAAEGLFRIVMVHHAPDSQFASWRHGLTDSSALVDLLEKEGAELVLHGHVHRSFQLTLQHARALIPVFGAPSASSNQAAHGRRAGYNICEITATAGKWDLLVRERMWSGNGSAFETAAEHHFEIPRLPVPH